MGIIGTLEKYRTENMERYRQVLRTPIDDISKDRAWWGVIVDEDGVIITETFLCKQEPRAYYTKPADGSLGMEIGLAIVRLTHKRGKRCGHYKASVLCTRSGWDRTKEELMGYGFTD